MTGENGQGVHKAAFSLGRGGRRSCFDDNLLLLPDDDDTTSTTGTIPLKGKFPWLHLLRHSRPIIAFLGVWWLGRLGKARGRRFREHSSAHHT